MNIKYIISLSMLVTLTSPSCRGAAWQLYKSFAGQCSSLFQQLTAALTRHDTAAVVGILKSMPPELRLEIAQYLDSSSLMRLAEIDPSYYQFIKTIPSFIQLKQLIERHNDDLVAALNDAIENDNTWPISYLIRRLNDDPATANIVNNTLITAINRHHINKVANLLQGGANPNATEKISGNPLLQIATFGGVKDDKIVELLLKYGANVDVEDLNGRTPLLFALCFNNITTVDLLIAAGADVEKTINILKLRNWPAEIDLLNQRYAQYRQKQHQMITAMETTE